MAEEYSDIKFEIKGQIGIIKVRTPDGMRVFNQSFCADRLTRCSSTDQRR